MMHSRLGRWIAGVGLALGVASLGACASDSSTLTDPGRPSFGGAPINPTGDRTVEFELFELCKDYSGQAGPSVTFDVTVDRDNNNTGADVSFQVTLADGECQEIWTDGGPIQDLVTVTEQVPVPAIGSYMPSFVKTKLVRTSGVDNVVVDAPVAGNSTSEAFSGDTPNGVVGVLVEFTNTYTPPPPALGRMTGGGNQIRIDGVRITRGFTIHCDIILSNNLEINWPGGNNWHITKPLTSAYCIDDPNVDPAPPRAPFDTFVGEGTGSLNGVAGSIVKFTFVDAGEPGTSDQAAIQIWAPGDDPNTDLPVLAVSGVLDHGNIQAHEDQPHK